MKFQSYTPTKILFGENALQLLKEEKLPGEKPLICVTSDGLMEKLDIEQLVCSILKERNIEYEIFKGVMPNPLQSGVMQATKLAKQANCDFVIGLGGGSSIDTAKATAIMMANDGVLWDYAYTGTGGKKEITKAAPIVAVSTTSGTGTEVDPYCVITNDETGEKLDFAVDAIFPTIAVIDPILMKTLPKSLTIYQGFDALFHAAECYITNQHENKLVDLYATDSIKTVYNWLPVVVKDGNNIEGRTHMAYAADILSGFTQSLVSTTSHHILAQTIGGLFPTVPHGAALLMVALAYYKKVYSFFPEVFEEMGEMLGEKQQGDKGASFVVGLEKMINDTGAIVKMSDYGITTSDFNKIADITVNVVGIDCDRYTLTVEDMIEILNNSLI